MRTGLLCLACSVFLFCGISCKKIASPPGQAETGYGSIAGYISDGYSRESVGNDADGTLAWYFVPDKLKNGASAPGIIFLHGYTAVDPETYYGHIEHLVKQGYIVIYPVYQIPSNGGSNKDLDQNVMLERAVDSVEKALEALGATVETGNLTAYGHSLGGLFAFCWAGAGGAPVRRIVMADANMDPSTGIPAFVIKLNLVTFIPYKDPSYGPAVTVPVIMLWGNSDTQTAPFSQQQQAYDLMVNAPSKVLYAAQSDNHGLPRLTASHAAPISPLNERTDLAQQDALDYRFFYAALDAALDGQDKVTFTMGNWSDGTPVKKVKRLLPE